MTGDARREVLGREAAGLTPAVEAAMREAAASAVLPRFRALAAPDIAEKSAGEVVTLADRESEALLSAALARILPAAAIVGEEAVHADPQVMRQLGAPLCWVIDPLDGTGYFAAGEEMFGVMVALSAHGIPVGGWILEPLGGAFHWAAAGQGSWGQGTRLVGGSASSARAIGLSPLLERRPQRRVAMLSRLRDRLEVRAIPRCAAHNYPAMLQGEPHLIYYERTLPWDHAAGVLLIEEAGGRAARLDGSDYRLDDDRAGLLVAADARQWCRVADLLQDLPD